MSPRRISSKSSPGQRGGRDAGEVTPSAGVCLSSGRSSCTIWSRSARSSRPWISYTCESSSSSADWRRSRHRRDIVLLTSTLHDVAETASLELELDRLEQVVRLVRHLEVGIARDPERRPLDDLHAWEELRQEVRDHVLHRHEPLPLAHGQEPRQRLGTLTRAKRSSPLSGSRASTPSESDSPEMYGNAAPDPRASGVSTGKTSRVKRRSNHSRPCAGARRLRTISIPSSASPGRSASSRASTALDELEDAGADRRERGAGRQSVGERTARPDASCPIRPATRTMKNSSRFEAKKRTSSRARASAATRPRQARAASRCTRPSRALDSAVVVRRLRAASSPSQIGS